MVLRKDKSIGFKGKDVAEAYIDDDFAAVIQNTGLILLDSFRGYSHERGVATPTAIRLTAKQVEQLQSVIETHAGLKPGQSRIIRRSGLEAEVERGRILLYNTQTYPVLHFMTVGRMASLDGEKILLAEQACRLYGEQKDGLQQYRSRSVERDISLLLRDYASGSSRSYKRASSGS